MIEKAEKLGKKLLLPVDTVVADSFPDPIDGPIEVETVSSDAIPADKEGLDIGEKTRALFADAAKTAKTVVWNGPMGVFENPTLAKGTIAVAKALAETDATTIIGGGMSYTFLKAQGMEVGKSLVDDEKLDYCKEMIEKAEKLGKKILLPVDTAVAASFPNPIDAEITLDYVDVTAMPADQMGLEIGP